MTDKILIVGATGLIGGLVVRKFVAQGMADRLHLLLRRAPGKDFGAVNIHVAEPEHWDNSIADINPSAAISCLGSTMKKAGSKEAFAAVDRDLVTSVAKAAKLSGARQFITVSSAMADSSASSFYLKVKGQAEDNLKAEQFDRLDIIQPGLLRGERKNDSRLGESLAIMASPILDNFLHGSLRKFRSIAADEVAEAIVTLVQKDQSGMFTHRNDAIWDLAKS